MQSENTNENEASNTITENAPNMNEFQQASVLPVEETANTTETEVTEVINETVTTTNNENINESKEGVHDEVHDATEPQIEDVKNEETVVPIETTEANSNQETTENLNQEVQVTTVISEVQQIPETTDTTVEVVQEEPTISNINENEGTTEENANTTTENPDENNDITTTNEDSNKESLMVEEVTVTAPVNNVENNFSEINNTVITENLNTEEAPITEITPASEEQQHQTIATDTYEDQVNPIPNEYYSAVHNNPTPNKTSIMKPVGVENYKFSSEPKAIPAPSQRRKYRDPYELEKMLSIQKSEFNQEKQRM